MAEIEEIALESHDPPENAQDILESIPENGTDIQPAPKKRGRPAGAKNKAKPAPKPKPAVKPKAKQKKPIEYEEYSESEEEEAPPPRRRTQREPIELDRHALASDVLNILQQQRYQRTTAKRNHYASWFENMS